MKVPKAVLAVLASALVLSAIVMVTVSASSGERRVAVSQRAVAMHDAPYRDGLFQGRLAALRGSENRPSVGRWNNDEARAHFILGFEEAYWDAASRID